MPDPAIQGTTRDEIDRAIKVIAPDYLQEVNAILKKHKLDLTELGVAFRESAEKEAVQEIRRLVAYNGPEIFSKSKINYELGRLERASDSITDDTYYFVVDKYDELRLTIKGSGENSGEVPISWGAGRRKLTIPEGSLEMIVRAYFEALLVYVEKTAKAFKRFMKRYEESQIDEILAHGFAYGKSRIDKCFIYGKVTSVSLSLESVARNYASWPIKSRVESSPSRDKKTLQISIGFRPSDLEPQTIEVFVQPILTEHNEIASSPSQGKQVRLSRKGLRVAHKDELFESFALMLAKD